MSERLRILIADDHEQCRWMLVRALSPQFDVIRVVADGGQLVEAAISLHPDVIVSDVSMPVMAGPKAMEFLKRKGCKIPFVLISSSSLDSDDYIEKGAKAFVDKIDIGHELAAAVSSAYFGQTYISRSANLEASSVAGHA